MRGRGATVLVLLALVSGCTHDATPRATPSPASLSPTAKALPRGIPLPPVPAEGVLVESGGHLRIQSLDGRRSLPLPGFHLKEVKGSSAYVTAADGTVFILDTSGPSAALVQEDPGLAVPDGGYLLPALPKAQKAGHWEWAMPGPDGRVLAQWSGECETPVAYVIDRDHHLRRVGPNGKQVDSYARGWTRAGLPVIEFPKAACGSGLPHPGLYVETSPGRYRLIAAADEGAFYRLTLPEPPGPPCRPRDFRIVASSEGATGSAVLEVGMSSVAGRRCSIRIPVELALRDADTGKLVRVPHNPLRTVVVGTLPSDVGVGVTVEWGEPYCAQDDVDLFVRDAMGHRAVARDVVKPRCDPATQQGLGPGLSVAY